MHLPVVLQIICQAEEKSSLKHLSHGNFMEGQVHHIWGNAGHDPVSVRKASYKAKVATHTYTLQADRAKFNQHQVDPTCVLCKKSPEDLHHFLLDCHVLEDVRNSFLVALDRALASDNETSHTSDNIQKDTLTGLVLDCHKLEKDLDLNPNLMGQIEAISRGMVFALHNGRTYGLLAATDDKDGNRRRR